MFDQDQESLVQTVIIIIVTIGFFNFFKKKLPKTILLYCAVFICTWAVTTFIHLIITSDEYSGLTGRVFTNSLAFSLPFVLIFGGITFFIKYAKFKKVKSL